MAPGPERPKPQPAVKKIPLRLRLKAWWEGNEVYLTQRTPNTAVAPARRVEFRKPDRPWETPRVRLLQTLWGEGFVTPMGREQMLDLVKPFGLNPAMSMLHLGAGLGGPARLFVQEFGTWVSGFEPDHELATAGAEMSTLAGMAKQAVITPIDLQNLELTENSLDAILATETCFVVEDKPRLLRYFEQALKVRGQILLTDLVFARRGGGDSPALRAWLENEPVTPHPWTADEYVRALQDMKIDIRITEDMTASFRGLVLQGLANYTASVSAGDLDPEMARCLAAEVDLWTRRIAAIDGGDLQVCRIYGLKKTIDKMLSDW